METSAFQSINFESQSVANSCLNNEKVMKFSFLTKILQEGNQKTAQQNLVLRPIKISRTRDRREQSQQTSAKNILKKVIIRQSSNKFAQKVRENFLMKGKMLSGSKKPLQNQMQSFLVCLNERINRQAQKNSQFPILNRPDIQTGQSNLNKRMHYHEIFRNLREVRLKKQKESSQSQPKIYEKFRQKSQLERNIPSMTISYNVAQNRESAQVMTPFPNVKLSKNIPLKKGYLAYDQVAKKFLQSFRQNMQKQHQKTIEKNKQITANAYMVVDYTNLTPISSRNFTLQIQIASLTKIMTCYLCLLICQKYSIDIYTYSVKVGDKAAQTPGTTAQLQNGDSLTVYELLLGLMLPSGNDASVAIAQAMGKIIQRSRKKQTTKSYYDIFIYQMNLFSKQLNLNQQWNNSSGLSMSPNYSTPQEMIILTSIAIKNPIFHKIVNTKIYEIDIKNERYGLNRKVTWRNTNRLLQCGWEGVKTGTTENAGHCLMARKSNLLICVFDCQSLSRRFSQCVKLYDKYQSYTSN